MVYSWKVTAHNIMPNKTATSGTRKFYLSAEPLVNNVPLAATLKTPTSAAGVASFTWEGSDPDAGDTLTYTLYVDKTDGKQTPPSAQTNLTVKTLAVAVDAGTTYYWRVKTSDGTHSSYSIIYSFKTD